MTISQKQYEQNVKEIRRASHSESPLTEIPQSSVGNDVSQQIVACSGPMRPKHSRKRNRYDSNQLGLQLELGTSITKSESEQSGVNDLPF
jgi:hypothetical protein